MPDVTHLVAKPKEILLLAKGLVEDMKKIETLNNDLKKDLEDVKKTWKDDSILEVNEYVTKIHKALEERKDNIGLIAQQLVTYAQALRKTK